MTTAGTRPFEGVRILDITHVLAGPFAAYQLALYGADVIKIEHPQEPDQSRESGSDHALNDKLMGTGFLTQASNKRSMTLNLKTDPGKAVLKRLVATADVLVENYRPGAFDALGLGYDVLSAINPRLIYASMSAFGQHGPRGGMTAYDHVIQATSGIMAMTGTEDVHPVKFGSPVIDYATGTMGAFALATALFQREKTGLGQRVDMAMLDVAVIMMSSHVADFTRTGKHPKPHGNKQHYATSSAYQTKDGMVMLGASNVRQQKRFWAAVGREDVAKNTNGERDADEAREFALIAEIMLTKTAAEWEDYLQSRHVPAGRVRQMHEALADPQLQSRNVLHRHDGAPGVEGGFTVPVSAFKLAHGGARVDAPPPAFGQHTAAILDELGYTEAAVADLRSTSTV
jgi:crotonobetainyl-CoA:carnitine CoA-transferase CaiB-like acyl-CoA transferase